MMQAVGMYVRGAGDARLNAGTGDNNTGGGGGPGGGGRPGRGGGRGQPRGRGGPPNSRGRGGASARPAPIPVSDDELSGMCYPLPSGTRITAFNQVTMGPRPDVVKEREGSL
jgi:hypothetical protein